MLFENIRADITRKRGWYLQNRGWLTRNLRVFLEPGTIAVIVYRYGNWVHRRVKNPILRILCKFPYWIMNALVVISTQICIASRAEIGKGFVIHNFSGIFIDGIIGENCTVYPGVIVGHVRHHRGKGQRKWRPPPRLGNNVYLGAGCKVMGDVVIGNNVVVGLNSVVLASVPDDCTVLGIPARIVSRNTQWLREKAELAQTDMQS